MMYIEINKSNKKIKQKRSAYIQKLMKRISKIFWKKKWDRSGKNMFLKTIKGLVGTLGEYTNTYLIYDEKTYEGVLIDIADNVEKIQEYVETLKIQLKYLILTHCHADHIGGLKEIKKKYPQLRILIHEQDTFGLTNDEINLSSLLEVESNFVEADLTLKDGDIIEVGELKIKVIHTPGHTKGSISLLVGDALFSGDTLFRGSHGRTDFPTGNPIEMIQSLEKLLQLPDEVIVYPGHERTTMIGEEK